MFWCLAGGPGEILATDGGLLAGTGAGIKETN